MPKTIIKKEDSEDEIDDDIDNTNTELNDDDLDRASSEHYTRSSQYSL